MSKVKKTAFLPPAPAPLQHLWKCSSSRCLCSLPFLIRSFVIFPPVCHPRMDKGCPTPQIKNGKTEQPFRVSVLRSPLPLSPATEPRSLASIARLQLVSSLGFGRIRVTFTVASFCDFSPSAVPGLKPRRTPKSPVKTALSPIPTARKHPSSCPVLASFWLRFSAPETPGAIVAPWPR